MDQIGKRLNALLVTAGLEPLDERTADRFGEFVSLLLRWNARMNLTSVRDEEGILSRHIVESIVVARKIPNRIGTLLDFGSGSGFPGIPIALCRPEIRVTMAESQGKKAAFLQEAVRHLELSAEVHGGRAETLIEPFDCVAMRAVDRMVNAVSVAVRLVRPGGWMALMTSHRDASQQCKTAGAEFSWREPFSLPGGDRRILMIGERGDSAA